MTSKTATLLFSLALAACSEGAPPADAPLLALEEPQYALLVDEAAGSAGRGLRTRLTQRGEWHFSLEYPVRMELTAEGVDVAKTTLRKDDASEFSEQALEFHVAFGDAPGKATAGRVTGTLYFGVCMTDQLCQPVSEEFEVAIR